MPNGTPRNNVIVIKSRAAITRQTGPMVFGKERKINVYFFFGRHRTVFLFVCVCVYGVQTITIGTNYYKLFSSGRGGDEIFVVCRVYIYSYCMRNVIIRTGFRGKRPAGTATAV